MAIVNGRHTKANAPQPLSFGEEIVLNTLHHKCNAWNFTDQDLMDDLRLSGFNFSDMDAVKELIGGLKTEHVVSTEEWNKVTLEGLRKDKVSSIAKIPERTTFDAGKFRIIPQSPMGTDHSGDLVRRNFYVGLIAHGRPLDIHYRCGNWLIVSASGCKDDGHSICEPEDIEFGVLWGGCVGITGNLSFNKALKLVKRLVKNGVELIDTQAVDDLVYAAHYG